MKPLQGEYYSTCHHVFRDATNQGELMVTETLRAVTGVHELSIASIGSGTGLFEISLLKQMSARGTSVRNFAGVDMDDYACIVLGRELRAHFDGTMQFAVYNGLYEDFPEGEHFDLILFNHTLEYFNGDPVPWIQKALRSKSARGKVLIFSPDQGGINHFYEENLFRMTGSGPLFSNSLWDALKGTRIPFAEKSLVGQCETSLLDMDGREDKKIQFLSFLTHIDCREVGDAELDRFTQYFISLREDGSSYICHPTTLFIL
ncbi:MAG: class I SAM-dependent methyltransferase [Anaerolineales bacterium]